MSARGRGVTRRLALGVVALVAALWSCGERTPDEELPEKPAIEVMELGRVGGRIYNEPERAHEILEGAGLTAEAFERRIRDVTKDSVLALAYTQGFQAVVRPRPARPAMPLPGTISDTVFVGPTRAAPRRSPPNPARAAPPPPSTVPPGGTPTQPPVPPVPAPPPP